MKALGALGIGSVELEKIDSVAYKTFIELEALGKLVDEGLVDELTVKQYEYALRDFNNALSTESFVEKAKSLGYGVKSIDDISIDINIDDIDFDIDDINLDEVNLDDIELDETTTDGKQEESKEDLDVNLDDIDLDAEEEKEEAVELVDSDAFGYQWEIAGGSKFGAIANLAVILSVSGSDNKIYYKEGSGNDDYFMLLLPKYEAKLIFSYPKYTNPSDKILSLSSLIDEAIKNKSMAYLTGANENLLEELIPLFDNSFYSNELGLTDKDLKKDIFDTDEYDEVINGEFDKGITGKTFSQNETNAVKVFKSLKDFEKGENLASVSNELSTHYPFGVNYIDYCYIPVQYLYEKGGEFIQVNSTVYYSPKQKKEYSFYEAGNHLKTNTIDVSKFARKSGIVSKSSFNNQLKAMPIMSHSNFGSAFEFSESRTYFYLPNGKFVSVNSLSIGYFKKYYGTDLEYLYSDEFIQVVQSGNVIGLIKTDGEKLSTAEKVELVFNIESFYSKLRSADSETFDFLRDVTEITGLSILGLSDKDAMPEAKPEPTIEEVEEKQEELKEEEELKDVNLDDIDLDSEEGEDDADDVQQLKDERDIIKDLLEMFDDEDKKDPDYIQLKDELDVIEMLLEL